MDPNREVLAGLPRVLSGHIQDHSPDTWGELLALDHDCREGGRSGTHRGPANLAASSARNSRFLPAIRLDAC